MRLYTLLKKIITGFAPISVTTFKNVTESYESENLIFYKGLWLSPQRFPNSAFLIVLTSPHDRRQASIYIVLTGTATDTSGAYALSMAASSSAPKLIKTTSGAFAPVWSSGSGIVDDITVSIIGLNLRGGVILNITRRVVVL